MKANGEIQITEELTLTNPSAEVKTVSYDWNNHVVNVELIFTESQGSFQHSRTFTFEITPTGELGVDDIYNFINTHKTLKNFR